MTSIAPAPVEAPSTATGVLCARDPERMFPMSESERPDVVTAGEAAALQVCRACPVVAACREAVLTVAPMSHGVAGGLTASQRRHARAARRGLISLAPSAPAPATTAATPDESVVLVLLEQAEHPGARTADPVAVERLAAGDRAHAVSRWEVALAAIVLVEHRGTALRRAADVLGEHERQLERWRNRWRHGQSLIAAPPGQETTAGTSVHRPPRRVRTGPPGTAARLAAPSAAADDAPTPAAPTPYPSAPLTTVPGVAAPSPIRRATRRATRPAPAPAPQPPAARSPRAVLAAAVLDREPWQDQALCAQTDPEAFFPPKGGDTKAAKRICAGCEVRAECLEYALTREERFGVWGGRSERERRALRRQSGAVA